MQPSMPTASLRSTATLSNPKLLRSRARNALQVGTFEEGARHSPPCRAMVASNAVYDTVRSSMKGQPDPLVERAIRQA